MGMAQVDEQAAVVATDRLERAPADVRLVLRVLEPAEIGCEQDERLPVRAGKRRRGQPSSGRWTPFA